MTIKRSNFFLAIALMILLPVLIHRLLYLAGTSTTVGRMSFEGMGNALDQLRPTYSVMFFKLGRDTVWFNAKANLDYKAGDAVPVRFRTHDPSDATLNTFTAVWLGTLLMAGIPLVMLLIIFLTPEIVPRGSRIKLSASPPFVFIENSSPPSDAIGFY
jgi:hypothetical protein